MTRRSEEPMRSGWKHRGRTSTVIKGETHWKCHGCKCFKPSSEYHKSNTKTPNGLASKCKKCKNAREVLVRDKDKLLAQVSAYKERMKRENPEKYHFMNRVKTQVYRAVKTGKLKKPTSCQTCGKKAKHIEAHHEDYNKPLDVVFLCKQCHGLRHRGSRT